MSAEELARQAVPGTLLLPGARMLPPPAVGPWVPFACVQLYDPILGPKPPEEGWPPISRIAGPWKRRARRAWA